MNRDPKFRVARRLALAVVAIALCGAAPASALTSCGSLNQPVCVEDPPPGVELSLSAGENPYGLKPLAQPLSGSQPLWPRVRGHKPYGFNAISRDEEGTTLSDEVFLHEQIGASMARVAADWAMIQYVPTSTSSGWSSWDYAKELDPEYRAFIRAGIRPLFTIIRTPRRFTRNAATAKNSNVTGCGTSDACWNPPVAANLPRLSEFAADLAKRYPLAAGIEVWNEPNLSNPFWGGETLDPTHYTAMLRTVKDAVQSVHRAMPVLGGALANFANTDTDSYGFPRMAMRTFLRRMLSSGAAPAMDAVSYHPYVGAYPTSPDPNLQAQLLFQAIGWTSKQIAGAYADAGQTVDDRLVPTEFGASTTAGFTEEKQSYWLTMQYTLWDVDHTNLALSSRTDGAFIHRPVEAPNPPNGNAWQEGYGLVKPKSLLGQFATKQAYCSFRTSFGGFSDCPAYLVPPGG